MSRCSFCGYENPDGRAMHLHMLRMHPEEYQAAGRDLEEVADGYIREPKQQRKLDRKRQEEEMTQKKAEPEEQIPGGQVDSFGRCPLGRVPDGLGSCLLSLRIDWCQM